MVLGADVTEGIIDFLLQFFQSPFIAQVTRAGNLTRPELHVETKSLDREFYPVVIEHTVDDPCAIEDTNLKPVLQFQLGLEGRPIFIFYELIGDKKDLRVAPLCTGDLGYVRDHLGSPLFIALKAKAHLCSAEAAGSPSYQRMAIDFATG